jgi:hypothetical protein
MIQEFGQEKIRLFIVLVSSGYGNDWVFQSRFQREALMENVETVYEKIETPFGNSCQVDVYKK